MSQESLLLETMTQGKHHGRALGLLVNSRLSQHLQGSHGAPYGLFLSLLSRAWAQ